MWTLLVSSFKQPTVKRYFCDILENMNEYYMGIRWFYGIINFVIYFNDMLAYVLNVSSLIRVAYLNVYI